MLASEIMKRNVAFIDAEATLEQAARAMRDANVGFLPVCEEERVIGALTDRDIAVRAVAEGITEGCVAAVMTPEVITCTPDEEVLVHKARMRDNHVGRIVCVDDRRAPIGIITFADLAQYSDVATHHLPHQYDLFESHAGIRH